MDTIQRQAIRERIEADSARPLTRERAELVRRIRHLQRLVRLHDHVFNEYVLFFETRTYFISIFQYIHILLAEHNAWPKFPSVTFLLVI